MPDVICLGELLVDFIPTVTGKDLIDTPAFQKAAGGAPGNVAVGLQQLGVDTAFVGKVGDDPFGYFLSGTLADKGVDVSLVKYSDEARTGLAFVSLKADGDREFLFYRHPSADMLLVADEIDLDVIRSARLLHFGSITLICEPVRSATLQAIAAAREAGCRISYDPNLRLPLWPDEHSARKGLELGLSKANVVKISEDEVEFLVGHQDLDRAKDELWHDDLQLMVITRGSKGCRYYSRELRGDVPTFEIEAIDATGAGDGFVAGLLQGVLKDPDVINDGQALHDLCRFANAVGAITATGRGAIPALPDYQRVQRFLDENR
ncbi:MAG: fructokinase [Gammaproteobacteria bacterium]|nr:fructokinase [Gammaproteobacteria bacterium]